MQLGSTRVDSSKYSDTVQLREEADTPTPFQEEREELNRVLNSPGIRRSASLVRFLTFICNKYFEGGVHEIRERTIAIEALGRKEAGFDSHADPIVRVTARELRKKLGEFYQKEGRNHPLQIVLPLGHYIPQFVRPVHPVYPVQESVAATDENIPQESEELIDKAAGSPEETDLQEVASPSNFQEPPSWEIAEKWGQKLWKPLLIGAGALAIFTVGFLSGRHTEKQIEPANTTFTWGEPVWSDEFDGAAHHLADPTKWTYDTGNQSGWGNHEIETYCDPGSDTPKGCDARHPNAFLDGAGHLVLRAERRAGGMWTSARISTKGLRNFQYGRIEARLKLPVGQGLWPAFWMLGSNFSKVGWPKSGSVDIAENVSLASSSNGLGPNMIRSTVHGPRYYGGNGLWHDLRLPNGGRVDDGSFHTYGIIWSPGMMQFYIDDPANVYFVQDASDIPEGGEWAFDHPFFLVMNLAVGGTWPGNPDATTPNPAEMLVDYVRLYKIPPIPAPSIQWQAVKVKAGSTVASVVSLRARNKTGRVYLSCSTEPATTLCSLGTSVLNFNDTPAQEDTVTLSTDSFTGKGRIVAQPGKYKLTITATTMSGDRSQLTVPFEVTGN